ncbi:hypothetical protein DV736_g981, partial [Chaetothyriales sp. CBS 134916]
MRNKLSSTMQKTYDEAYLACSTAIFFEGQNNEAEALRSWRSALDQLYFFNAYRLPSNYTPKSETEKALFDSIKKLELQCKERVDLLEALRRSRAEAKEAGDEAKKSDKDSKDSRKRLVKDKGRRVDSPPERPTAGWLGDETVPPLSYTDLPHASPALPPRPSLPPRHTSDTSLKDRAASVPYLRSTSLLGQPPLLPVPHKVSSRSPSPDSRKAMRTTLRPEKKAVRPSRPAQRPPRQAPVKAAGMAWDSRSSSASHTAPRPESDPTIEARLSATAARRSLDSGRRDDFVHMPDPRDYTVPSASSRDRAELCTGPRPQPASLVNLTLRPQVSVADEAEKPRPPAPPAHMSTPTWTMSKPVARSPPRWSRTPDRPTPKRQEPAPRSKSDNPMRAADKALGKASAKLSPVTTIARKPVGGQSSAGGSVAVQPESDSDTTQKTEAKTTRRPPAPAGTSADSPKPITPPSTSPEHSELEDNPDADAEAAHEQRSKKVLKNVPRGIDLAAARAILNEVIVRGDEVHWDDVAGLELAKAALKEAVVYPFLRPDLFMGLREPARGMLLFGPPGTGKTMLARAVATESKSTFFAISASSLTSKWHGESEKLVRALFSLAKVMSPSIIFVDEIDSLLSKRGDNSEHEASRRSKTEFLIQWSDLQKAAAGKEPDKRSAGDPSRVLVLAATNCPWDIDDAARRRFVRRQYIPLPEADTREKQLRTLLGHQKHDLAEADIEHLVELTDGQSPPCFRVRSRALLCLTCDLYLGYSGSDITALAKDAAMGPLRNLGEALLFTPPENIRAIQMADFEKSLESIRPSVSKRGLEEFDKWAKEFGERAG